MMRNKQLAHTLPDWLRETSQVLQRVRGSVRNIEIELHDARHLHGLDPRLRIEFQHVLEALGIVQVSLSVVDMIADRMIEQIAEDNPTDPQAGIAGPRQFARSRSDGGPV